jgi:error-prone DNA polymerase
MLTCIRKALALIGDGRGNPLDMAHVPAEDPAVYDMLCRADSLGVFQVESRAQMSMLPRLRPRNFYDLVIEVAIVRPGPIQGDMVHPYLRRRRGEEPVSFPKPELAQVLGKTLGVPLFQEQAMRIAIVAAGFTPDEADRLRRAMATFRKTGTIPAFRRKLVAGMVANGYEEEFADRCFRQIEGFGEYGFPESHAASFALLVYVSAWIKCHHPAAFACALLNSQPMGFYAPAQIVRDAREHGVEVLPPDVTASGWDCTLEPRGSRGAALRLGLRQIKGLQQAAADALVAARGEGAFTGPADLARRAGLALPVLERLADADAFRGLGLDRRQALWAVKGLGAVLEAESLPLFAATGKPANEEEARDEGTAPLPAMTLGEHVVADYAALRLSLKAHPLAFLRKGFAAEGVVPAKHLEKLPHGARAKVAGLVLVRQRPGSANGVIFATLEDETGIVNLVIWTRVFEAHRRIVLASRLLAAEGEVQREGIVIHLIAEHLRDESHRLADLARHDAPMEPALARADEVVRPARDLRAEPTRRVIPRSRDFR